MTSKEFSDHILVQANSFKQKSCEFVHLHIMEFNWRRLIITVFLRGDSLNFQEIVDSILNSSTVKKDYGLFEQPRTVFDDFDFINFLLKAPSVIPKHDIFWLMQRQTSDLFPSYFINWGLSLHRAYFWFYSALKINRIPG